MDKIEIKRITKVIPIVTVIHNLQAKLVDGITATISQDILHHPFDLKITCSSTGLKIGIQDIYTTPHLSRYLTLE